MFTGLIQAVGKVTKKGNRLLVTGCETFSDLTLGESIAVDGVCLTVADCYRGGFIADVSEETLSRTTLGIKSEKGGFVNLERALRFSDRLGGHLVSGHVDGLGKVISIDSSKDSWRLELSWQNSFFEKYMCEKASVSVDGISLTVAGLSKNGSHFWIAVIPHTWTNTSLEHLLAGTFVNLEVDLMAKYVESLLGAQSINDINQSSNPPPEITQDWLDQNGWS